MRTGEQCEVGVSCEILSQMWYDEPMTTLDVNLKPYLLDASYESRLSPFLNGTNHIYISPVGNDIFVEFSSIMGPSREQMQVIPKHRVQFFLTSYESFMELMRPFQIVDKVRLYSERVQDFFASHVENYDLTRWDGTGYQSLHLTLGHGAARLGRRDNEGYEECIWTMDAPVDPNFINLLSFAESFGDLSFITGVQKCRAMMHAHSTRNRIKN